MFAFRQRLIAPFALAASLLGVSTNMSAQASRSATEHPDSRVDVYGGYGYFHPINSGVGSKRYRRSQSVIRNSGANKSG